MESLILIADGGSTKCDWVLIGSDGTLRLRFTTPGFNPAAGQLPAAGDLTHLPAQDIVRVEYYGAGCVADVIPAVVASFRRLFPNADVIVDSDMLGAARALLGRSEGIACIIGTGSNSCHYDGVRIVDSVAAGGFILGDEGSGAVLGRMLLADVVKGLLPADLAAAFAARWTELDYTAIVREVYRSANPRPFLGSFAPFLSDNMEHPYVRSLVGGAFEAFLIRNVTGRYPSGLTVNFAGSIAWHFAPILTAVVESFGLSMGSIVKSPLDAICQNSQGMLRHFG